MNTAKILTAILTNAFAIAGAILSLKSGGSTQPIRLSNSWYVITEVPAPK